MRAMPRPARRLHQHTDAPDVAFPTAELLMQRSHADDLTSIRGKQREVAAQINLLAPLANDGEVGDAML